MMAAPRWRGWRWLWPWAADTESPEERDPGLARVRRIQDETRDEINRLRALHDEADLYLRRERDDMGKKGD